MKPVYPIIRKAFSELGYEHPELETQLLLLLIEVLWKKEANGELKNADELSNFLAMKYNL